jgi:uncharacterized protein with HEPN domain
MNRDYTSILDALIFAKNILNFIAEMDQATFENDLKTQSAVLYQISILGEAIKRISPEFQQQHPEIPYGKIIGMRNKLVHDYDGINIDLVWTVINTNIPELINFLEKIVPLQET